MGSLFHSPEYDRYRFDYPDGIFHGLKSFLNPSFRPEPLRVLDLGCGTGLATESFLRFYSASLKMNLLDIDPEMLEVAKKKFQNDERVTAFFESGSEKIPLPDASLDLVLIASAWHWMNESLTLSEVERVLTPTGGVFIFEYQFPKAPSLPRLNDWIREKFNVLWKPSHQKPRGTLRELTQGWRSHPQFYEAKFDTLVHSRFHHAEDLRGVIVSQSRYLHYEKTFPDSEQMKLRDQLKGDLDSFLKGNAIEFVYGYEGYFFKKRL